jgi:hypothetical protein
VISAHNGIEAGTSPIEHAVGIRPVTGQIAAAGNAIVLALGGIENGFEGLPIAV